MEGSIREENAHSIQVTGDEEFDEYDASHMVTIEEGREYKYLGVRIQLLGPMFTPHGSSMVKKAKALSGQLWDLAKHYPNRSEAMKILWNTVGLPSILYGAELVSWLQDDIKEIEMIQKRVARQIAQASQATAIGAILGEVGFSDFQASVIERRLNYFGRLARLQVKDPDRWCVHVAMEVLQQVVDGKPSTEWAQSLIDIANSCEINLGDAETLHKDGWNKMVREQLKKVTNEEWVDSLQGKSTLRFYRGYKEEPSWEKYLNGSSKAKLIFEARTGTLKVQAYHYHWGPDKSTRCPLCDAAREDIEHFLLHCPHFEPKRITLLEDLEGEGQWFDEGVSDIEKVKCLLGLGNWVAYDLSKIGQYLEECWEYRSRYLSSKQTQSSDDQNTQSHV